MLANDKPTKEADSDPPEPVDTLPEGGTRRVDLSTPADGTKRVFGEEHSQPHRIQPLGYLQPGHILLDRYEVFETIHPHETEIHGVFVCREGGRKVVVKVASLNHPPKRDLWERLTGFEHPNVLKVYETLERNGLFYEVQEYCAGGSLSKRLAKDRFSAEWVMEVLVPQVNEALKYLHAAGIVHRDIKPANIYLRDESTVVVGDFDISSVLEKNRTSRDTKRGAGTWEYMPPEAFPRFVDPSGGKAARVTRTADYYSLGITIIELVLGTTSLHASDLPDLFDFYLSGGQIELPSGPQPLVRLLRGLLIRDRSKRWSGEEVDRWIAQQNSYEDVQAILDDEYFSLRRATVPYTIHQSHATDLPGLAEVLEKYPDEALADYLKSDRLTNWVSQIDMNVARLMERDRETWRGEPENCLFRCILLCDRSRPFPILGIGYAKTKREWLEKIVHSGKSAEMIAAGPVNFQELRKLDSWLALKPDPEKELAARVGAVLWQPSDIRFEEIAFAFDPTLPYSHTCSALDNLRRPPEDREGARTPQELVSQAYGPDSAWDNGVPECYLLAYERWRAGYLAAWMRQHGLGQLANQAYEACSELAGHPYAAFESFLRHLDPRMPEMVLTFEPGDVKDPLDVEYGQSASQEIRYTISGVGMPFGSVRLAFAPEGLSLHPRIIDRRVGALTMTVDSRLGIPVSKAPRITAIELAVGNFKFAGDRPVLRYRVHPSATMGWRRVALGAGLGMFIMSGARLVVMDLIGPGAVNPHINPTTFERAARWDFPEGNHGIAALVVLIYLLIGFRVWLWALRRSEL